MTQQQPAAHSKLDSPILREPNFLLAGVPGSGKATLVRLMAAAQRDNAGRRAGGDR